MIVLHHIILIYSDCGELQGDEYEKATHYVPDSTGDLYEDYPQDQQDDFGGPKIVEIASKMKTIGNEAFKAGNLHLALDKYQKGLRYLHESPEVSESDPADTTELLRSIKTNLNLNCALLHVKLKQYEEATKSATYVLEEEKANNAEKAKALYRRALALTAQKADEDAQNDLEMAVKFAPSDAAIQSELALVKKKIAERTRKEKAAYKKFFE